MILSKDEAMSLVLEFSDRHIVDSKTKLNKLLARLNLYFIPIDFNFSLNKYGSFNADLAELGTNDYYEIQPYRYGVGNRYVLKPQGRNLFETNVRQKLSSIFTEPELNEIRQRIHHLSSLKADAISDDEHKILLVDVDERFKLEQRLNEVTVELSDLYANLDMIEENRIIDIRLKALIEFSFHLAFFLKKKRFKRLDEAEYDFDAHMFDYYFLYHIYTIIPFLKEQVSKEERDAIKINRYYEYILNSVKTYPFSLENKDLHKLICS